MTWEEVRAIACEWPGVEDGSYHGYPAMRVAGRFLLRLGDDRQSLEFKGIEHDRREMLTAAEPAGFFALGGQTSLGVRLDGLDEAALRGLIDAHRRRVAPKSLQAAATR